MKIILFLTFVLTIHAIFTTIMVFTIVIIICIIRVFSAVINWDTIGILKWFFIIIITRIFLGTTWSYCTYYTLGRSLFIYLISYLSFWHYLPLKLLSIFLNSYNSFWIIKPIFLHFFRFLFVWCFCVSFTIWIWLLFWPRILLLLLFLNHSFILLVLVPFILVIRVLLTLIRLIYVSFRNSVLVWIIKLIASWVSFLLIT